MVTEGREFALCYGLRYTFAPTLIMPKEQRPTIQSPLADLVKPGTLRQEPLPGLERFAPRDTSRFSVKRMAFTLRRGAETIKAVLSRDGSKGHVLKTEHQASGSS